MPRLFLVRHGEAQSAFTESLDPGLSLKGRAQVEALANRLAHWPPMKIWSSPLQRARQSAQPLATQWQSEPQLEPRVAEIPTPDGNSLADRGPWLREFMNSNWREAPAHLQAWRQSLVQALTSIEQDTIVFTHFVAINVAAGAATGQDRVTCVAPDHASLWSLEVDHGALLLSALGAQIGPPSASKG